MASNLITIDEVIGLPPATYISDIEVNNSMPVLMIMPQKPQIASGTTLFRLTPAEDDYRKIINDLGYSPTFPIKIAFQADSLPSDTFSNDYTETFLQKFTDVASQGISQLMQMTGSETFSEGVGKIGTATKELGDVMEGSLGSILSGAGGVAIDVESQLRRLQGALASSSSKDINFIGGAANTINKMLAGHRVDYPKVWGNSAYNSNFSVTVKLFNPKPGNSNATKKYISGPLAILLTLGVPRSGDGYSYNWPFFHKVIAPGFFMLDPAVITNITVTKGGDQHQLAFTKTLGMVDVRIDFASLYDSMVVGEPDTKELLNRPTIKNYLNNLEISSSTNRHTSRKGLIEGSAQRAGQVTTPNTGVKVSFQDPKDASKQLAQQNLLEKNLAAAKRQGTAAIDNAREGVSRVTAETKIVSAVNTNLNSDFISDIVPF